MVAALAAAAGAAAAEAALGVRRPEPRHLHGSSIVTIKSLATAAGG